MKKCLTALAVMSLSGLHVFGPFSAAGFVNTAIDASNAVAPEIDVTAGFSGAFNENHPWANFTY